MLCLQGYLRAMQCRPSCMSWLGAVAICPKVCFFQSRHFLIRFLQCLFLCNFPDWDEHNCARAFGAAHWGCRDRWQHRLPGADFSILRERSSQRLSIGGASTGLGKRKLIYINLDVTNECSTCKLQMYGSRYHNHLVKYFVRFKVHNCWQPALQDPAWHGGALPYRQDGNSMPFALYAQDVVYMAKAFMEEVGFLAVRDQPRSLDVLAGPQPSQPLEIRNGDTVDGCFSQLPLKAKQTAATTQACATAWRLTGTSNGSTSKSRPNLKWALANSLTLSTRLGMTPWATGCLQKGFGTFSRTSQQRLRSGGTRRHHGSFRLGSSVSC